MANDSLDADGQPLNPSYNRGRRTERDISELLGLVKGVLADGIVTDDEAVLLGKWLMAHPDTMDVWPGKVLADRLTRIFADGVIDEEERRDLEGLLNDLVGGQAGLIVGETAATSLPLDDPAPAIEYPGCEFVLTGRFAMGPRPACEALIRDLGGLCGKGVTKRTNYLVIGTFGSRDWAETAYGRKIEKAVHYRDDRGWPLAIVGEDHWAESLSQ